MKAAVLGWHLVRNHPLPDGNKRTAYAAMREFVARNGGEWQSASVDETESVMVAAAAGEMEIETLAAWVAERLGT